MVKEKQGKSRVQVGLAKKTKQTPLQTGYTDPRVVAYAKRNKCSLALAHEAVAAGRSR